MSAFSELLASEFSPYGRLQGEQLDRLERHYSLLTQWNKRLNLTRIVNLSDAVRLHYCESLLLGQHLPPGQLRVVDVGSGAGFPGIPAAILRPDCHFDLVESHRRKAVFLVEASRELPNARVLAQRAENCAPEYDWMISRAPAHECG
jgi:16S rRNA (guanine527-N7)-methyltransferase